MKYTRPLSAFALAAIACGSLLSTAPTAKAQAAEAPAASATKLSVGSKAPALEGITWLQGEPVTSLDEKDKVYLLELWATWCGPCIAIIPHVNDWHKKYADKGLVIVGMNVFEDGEDTAKSFLKSQGEGMSYRVAYSGGNGSAFAKNWLKPAGVNSTPHALIIKDGKILFSAHPGSIQDSTLEKMLSDDFDAAAFATETAKAEKAQADLEAKLEKLFTSEDWDGLLKVASELEDSNPMKLQLQLTAVSKKNDWKGLLVARNQILENTGSPISVEQVDQNAALSMNIGEGAVEYATVALAAIKAVSEETPAAEKIHLMIVQSRLLFITGKKDEAKALIKNATALLEKVDNPQFKAQVGPLLPAIEKALAEDTYPSIYEIMGSLQK